MKRETMFNPSKWANSPLGSDFSCQSYSFLKGLSFFLSGFSPSNAKAQVVLVQSCPEAQEVSWSPMQKPNLSTVFQFSFLSYHQHLNKFNKKPNPTKQKTHPNPPRSHNLPSGLLLQSGEIF